MVSEFKDIESGALKWEDSIKKLMAQCSQTLNEDLRMAIFSSMMPMMVQEYITK